MLYFVDVTRDPVHNYIHFTETEESVINSPFFQRLRLIKQTPGASWVYPGANHTRLEHSLGVMHLAGELAQKLLSEDKSWKELPENEKAKRVQKVRLAGLLHDIGHGPFSHVFEEFLKKVNARINHEHIGEVIINKKISSIIKETPNVQWNDEDVKDIVGWLNESRYGLGSIITESINVDALDYLVRDAYYTGTKEYGFVDVERIIDNINVVRLFPEENQDLKETGTIVLRKRTEREKIPDKDIILAINERAIIAVESFFVSRLEMYEAVYYHRTVRAIECGLVNCMYEIFEDVEGLKMFEEMTEEDLKSKDQKRKFHIDRFLYLNDYSVLGKILEKNSEDFNKILRRKQKRMVLEKLEAVTSDESAEYLRRVERRHQQEEEIRKQLANMKIEEDIRNSIVVDVPFPLLPIKIGRIYITYEEDGMDKISTIHDYGRRVERCPPVLKLMIRNDMLRIIEQKVFADTEDCETLRKIGDAARNVLGGGGTYPSHI